jgi:hypothetical protein
MIEEVETGGVIFSDLTYPTESTENKRYLLVKTSTEKDFIYKNKIVINLTIIYRFINKGSNKIIDALKSQTKYRIKIKYDVSIEELYTIVYLPAMENFIKTLKEKDINNDILQFKDINPLSIESLRADLIDLYEKIKPPVIPDL